MFKILTIAAIALAGTATATSAAKPYNMTMPQTLERLAYSQSDFAPSEYMVARLVGYGCTGASGPLLAQEESDLPKCTTINRLPQDWAIPLESE